jgi:hypothetical protein
MSIEFWSLIFVWFIGFIIPLLILIGILRWTKLGKFLNQVVDKVVDFTVAQGTHYSKIHLRAFP